MSLLNTEKKKIIITSVLSAILVAALAWFVFFYQSSLIVNLSDAVQKEKLDSFVKQEKSDKIFKLKSELNELESEKKEMEAMLPAKDSMVSVLTSLEKIAVDASVAIKIEAVDISKIKIGQSTKATKSQDEEEDAAAQKNTAAQKKAENQATQDDMAKLKKFPAFSLTVTGNYQSLVDFVTKMENLPYFIRVLTIDAVPSVKEKQQGSGSGTLSVGNPAAENQANSQPGDVRMALLVVIYTKE